MKQVKKFIAPIFIVFVFVFLAAWKPDMAARSSKVTWNYLKEMAIIMPPVFILMGLMEIWIPKDKIQKWFGSGSGIKGAGIALALGTLPTGPVYIAFPMTAALIRKGAGYANMVIFLGSWAALKIPQLMIEIKFLGASFVLARLVLTLIALVLMGLSVEAILRKYPDEKWTKRIESENKKNIGEMEIETS